MHSSDMWHIKATEPPLALSKAQSHEQARVLPTSEH